MNKAVLLLIINLAIWLIFSVVYTIYLMVAEESWATPLGEGEEFTFIDKVLNGVYASTIIHTSVGFGDFYPKTFVGKMLVTAHAFLVFFINIFVGAMEFNTTPY